MLRSLTRRGLATALVVILIFTSFALSTSAARHRVNSVPVERSHEQMRRQMDRAMEDAARIVGGEIRAEEIAIGSSDGMLVAVTRLHGVADLDALAYLSFPTFACAGSLPPGFYTINFTTNPDGSSIAIFGDLSGQRAAVLPAFVSELPDGSLPVVATSSPQGVNTPCVDLGDDGVTYLNLIDLTCDPTPEG